MAKAAINHFARTLAAELTASRINVNVVNPGWIDTPGERAFASEAEIEPPAPGCPGPPRHPGGYRQRRRLPR